MKNILLLLLTVITVQAFAQKTEDWCLTTYYDSIRISEDSTILDQRIEIEEMISNNLQKRNKSEDKIIIPVVFHVLHEYGNAYLTLEQIEAGIRNLNNDYNAINADLDEVIPEFKNIIGDANIEFRLAKLDPDGNCTTGVNYYETPLTNQATYQLQYEIQSWDSYSYLNIWTVLTIQSGAAAWSYIPPVSTQLDGVISKYEYVQNGHTIAHEVGHYLNLYHPWGDSNDPDIPSNCNMTDYVDDTPETIGAAVGSCNLEQESCGSLDNVQNIMDYGGCDVMFTQGQADRMRALLNTSTNGRNQLWTEANLMETGVSDAYVDPGCAPIADFIAENQVACPGSLVSFSDYSSGRDIAQWEWTFEGGEPNISNDENPEVMFSTPGYHDITLTVTNEFGSHTITKENHVFVKDTEQGIVAPALVDMEDAAFPYYTSNEFLAWTFEKEGSQNWKKKQTVDNFAMSVYNPGNPEGAINSMITSNINLSQIDNPEYIYFDLAYAQRNSSSNEKLKVFTSVDCGDTWQLKYIKSGASLTTVDDYVMSSFVPEADEWKTEKLSISNASDANHMQIKFELESQKGNYLYIDNLQIGDLVSNKTNKIDIENFEVYPNPARKKLNVSYSLTSEQNISIEITNMVGQKVYSAVSKAFLGTNTYTVDLEWLGLKKGIYAITLKTKNGKFTEKLILDR